MSDKIDLTSCELKECTNSTKNPVTLPCGYTICQSHVEQYSSKDNFKCPICDLEHIMIGDAARYDLNNNCNLIEINNCVNMHFMNLNDFNKDNDKEIQFDEFEKIADGLNFI
jgi:hypothetical protein